MEKKGEGMLSGDGLYHHYLTWVNCVILIRVDPLDHDQHLTGKLVRIVQHPHQNGSSAVPRDASDPRAEASPSTLQLM